MIAALALVGVMSGTASAQSKKPNILIIWGDDIGTYNISAYHRGLMGGSTPNIDRLAKEGMLFMDHYAHPSCTAGRSAFITGQYPIRVGLASVGLPGAEQGVYSYANKENCEELVDYIIRDSLADPVVKRCEEVALSAWRALGCRDGGRIDLRCDEGERPYFLEVNPLAGLHPDHSDLPIIAKGVGLGYQALIERILSSACKRIKTLNTVF